MTRREDILIVIGHDNARMYGEMADANISQLKKYGYDYLLEDFSNTGRHPWFAKAGALLDAMNRETHRWIVWMDADSVMLRPFDELFERDYDMGLLVKERERYDLGLSRSTPHGDYFYSHLIGLQAGRKAKWFLEEWIEVNKKAKGRESDLKGVHRLLETIMEVDVTLFDRLGEIVNTPKCKISLYDPYIYGAMDGILEMRESRTDAKVVHFKGRALKRAWKEYREKVLCL